MTHTTSADTSPLDRITRLRMILGISGTSPLTATFFHREDAKG